MNKSGLQYLLSELGFAFVFVFLPYNASSQINTPTWGVDDTSICVVKSVDFVMVHDYIELFNNSGGNQQMRWIRYTDPNWPVEWEAGFTDPDSFYVNVLNEDTAEFIMLDPIEFSNQLIINVDHNNHIDTSYLRFKVYPIAAPADSLWLKFCIIITAQDASLSEFQNELKLVHDPNQQTIYCIGDLNASVTISLFDLNGKIILQQKISTAFELISVSHLMPGIYFAEISGLDFQVRQKLILN